MAITDMVQWSGLGASASATYSVIQVTAIPTILLSANINRLSVIVQNQTDNDVFLGFDTDLTAANYFLRLRQFDAYEIDATNMWVGYLIGITAAGNANVSVAEKV